MSIKSFKNQGLFNNPSNLDIDGFAVDTFVGSLDTTQQKSALLFDGDDSIETDTPASATVLFDGATYSMDIDEGYDGQVFAIINTDRQSVQFIFDKDTEAQTPIAAGFDSVGPAVRRLATLGYI